VGSAPSTRFEDADRFPILNEKTIVEMKFTATMPAAFRRLVEDYALDPVRVSKYRLSIEGLGVVSSDNESRSDACA